MAEVCTAPDAVSMPFVTSTRQWVVRCDNCDLYVRFNEQSDSQDRAETHNSTGR